MRITVVYFVNVTLYLFKYFSKMGIFYIRLY